jgi:hypothetical protein
MVELDVGGLEFKQGCCFPNGKGELLGLDALAFSHQLQSVFLSPQYNQEELYRPLDKKSTQKRPR